MTAAATTCEALLEIAHLLTHSVSHCQFMFQTQQQLVRMVLYLGCNGQRAVPPALWVLVYLLIEAQSLNV